MTEFTMIRAERSGASLIITLSNPKRKNAIGPVMINDLLHALKDAEGDSSIRTIILTGEGDAFCAGGDFAQMTSGGGGKENEPLGDYADLALRIFNFSKPVIAKVNGTAMGGGIGLVAASHFAIAKRGVKLGTPEIDVGLFPMMIMAVLHRIVPRRRFLEMSLFGERFDADEALRLGLVNQVVDGAELDAAVDALAAKIHSKSPIIVKLGLDAYAAQDDLELEKALPLLRERLGACLATDDAREGLTAFLEKRSPNWTGK